MSVIAISLVHLLLASAAQAEDSEPASEPSAPEAPRLLIHPDGPGASLGRVAAYAALEIAPTQVVEDEVRFLPSFAADGRFGLPYGVSIVAELETQFVTTWLRVGPAVSFDAGPVGFLLGYLGVPWFGLLQGFGFDTLIWGVENQPLARVGVHVAGVYLTVEAALQLSMGRWARLGGYTADMQDGPRYLGTHVMFHAERPLDNGGLLLFGAGFVARRGEAVTWAAFLDETAILYFPRIEVSYGF